MLAPSPQLTSVVTTDGAVILDAKQNLVISIDPIGGYIWDRLGKGQSVESIVLDLVTDTGAMPEVVERDVQEFLADLFARHLLVDSSGRRTK
ncbi:PqqD family protein [Edaphobacter dinghuensis]|uniref:Coenzyme PQQ synthesis protein D (PqqD) n=1 Tax=Edaphobacter dinghuensis TaxID=1560005 RepID=A0A917MB29_9BACT|nr:PqqD family protein [Edaphobacter dinghuensis]GGG86403.1 hypothetical protein GCM10011585_32910 [Edaphobacter dinghuensis]